MSAAIVDDQFLFGPLAGVPARAAATALTPASTTSNETAIGTSALPSARDQRPATSVHAAQAMKLPTDIPSTQVHHRRQSLNAPLARATASTPRTSANTRLAARRRPSHHHRRQNTTTS